MTFVCRAGVVGALLLSLNAHVANGQPAPANPPAEVSQFRLEDGQISCPTPEELRSKGWFQPLDQVTASLLEHDRGEHPLDCARDLFATDPSAATNVLGPFPPSHFMWAPSHLWHQPVYFSDVTLEQYGQSICPPAQPLLSAAHFYLTFPIIPYQLGLDHPYESISTLGYYRPGSPTPTVRKHLPLQWNAAALESAAWVGAIFLLP